MLIVISHQAATLYCTMEQGLLVRECMNDFCAKRDISNIQHLRLIDLFIESAVNYIENDTEKTKRDTSTASMHLEVDLETIMR